MRGFPTSARPFCEEVLGVPKHVRLRRVVGVEETDDLETCASFVKWLWQTHHDSHTQGAEESYKKLQKPEVSGALATRIA